MNRITVSMCGFVLAGLAFASAVGQPAGKVTTLDQLDLSTRRAFEETIRLQEVRLKEYAQRIERLEADRDTFYRDFAECGLRINQLTHHWVQKPHTKEEDDSLRPLISSSHNWMNGLIKRANDRDEEKKAAQK